MRSPEAQEQEKRPRRVTSFQIRNRVAGENVRVADVVSQLAIAIGRIAARFPERAVVPHAVVPIYVRKPDAEIARDRRAEA